MSNLLNIQRKISEGISGWMLFEINCLRGSLFNEKYLSFPIGQILNGITNYKIISEANHPYGNIGRGRPLQIDFVLIDGKSNWKYAFESKWVGDTTISLASMVWDLIRLQNLFELHPDIKSYFILAGFDKKLKILLKDFSIIYNGKKEEYNFIQINNSHLTFNLLKLDASTKKFINGNIKKYPKFKLYSKIYCKPAHKFPKKDIVNMTFSTYVFEVLKPKRTEKISEL